MEQPLIYYSNVKFILKLIASFPAAYFGGNIIFGILFDGSWVPDFLSWLLKPTVLNITLISLLWFTRIIAFIALIFFWILEDKKEKDVQKIQS